MSNPPRRENPDKLGPGSRFGRYEIVKRLGQGGMATVYEAKHIDLDKRVALKMLHLWLSLRHDIVQRFVREARTAARIQHPHVVGISDIGVEHDIPFMAMDLLEGEELSTLIDRGVAIPLERVADILLPVISAVAMAHDRDILHRDLKPDNIFLARRPPRGEHPVLLDFGISKMRDSSIAALTEAGEVLGTPPYLSPEVVTGGMDDIDARADQYALGVILYECATGRLPYPDPGSLSGQMEAIAKGGAPPPSALRPGLPAAFDAVVMRAMAVERDARFPSVIELGRALLPFASPLVQAIWSPELRQTDAPPPVPSVPAGQPIALKPEDVRVIPCLAECPDHELAELLSLAPGVRLPAGAQLFVRGAPGDSCFLLLKGEVEVQRTDETHSVLPETVGPGMMLGQVALVDGGPRSVSASTSMISTVMELRREVFDALGARCPAVVTHLVEDFALTGIRRLREATSRLDYLLKSEPSTQLELAARDQALVELRAAIGEWSLAVEQTASFKKRR
ncbi:MAG: serine/threonine-protein kinase [Byssovorax sp.]